MSSLQWLMREWASCSSQIRDILVQSMCSDFTHSKIPKYQVESCGSGVILGHFTKRELQEWLKTHQLFLGHGGTNITSINDIPSNYQDPIVAMKIVFRGELYKTLEGYITCVVCAAWSPDGQTLASTSVDVTVELWNIKDCTPAKILYGHSHFVMSVAWSPDGQTLASGSHDKTIKLWSKDGELLKTLEGYSAVTCVAWSPNGKTIASGSFDKTINLWNQNGKLMNTLEGHTAPVTCVAWNPNSFTLASASRDNALKIWSTDGKLLETLEGHTLWVMYIAWSPDGSILVSTSRDRTIRLWAKNNKPIKIQNVCPSLWVTCIAWSPDNKTFASAASNKSIKVWNRNGELIKTLELPSPARWAAWNFNGAILAGGLHTGDIKLWT